MRDPISTGDYFKEEDPKLYNSVKTGRGPLEDSWRQDYSRAIQDPNNTSKAIMTAYKLCKVEFRYWGMQNKIERFIHDIGELIMKAYKLCRVDRGQGNKNICVGQVVGNRLFWHQSPVFEISTGP